MRYWLEVFEGEIFVGDKEIAYEDVHHLIANSMDYFDQEDTRDSIRVDIEALSLHLRRWIMEIASGSVSVYLSRSE